MLWIKKTEAYYHTVPGSLGNRLRAAMVPDADGDILFQKINHHCPFWNEKHLCDIQIALGEKALCHTCRQFPRLAQDYGDFVEYDLSIACPEAARMLLTKSPESLTLYTEEHPELPGDAPVYDAVFMTQLRLLRENMFTALRDTSKPALEQLAYCLELTMRLQQKRNSSISVPEVSETSAVFSEQLCLSVLLSCNILTKDWKHFLTEAAAAEPVPILPTREWDMEIRAYAFDFLYRHLLCTAFHGMVLCCIQQLLFSVCAVCIIIQRRKLQTQTERLRIWQLYVKEIEYDSDNLERLEFFLGTESAFSGMTLASYCRKNAQSIF